MAKSRKREKELARQRYERRQQVLGVRAARREARQRSRTRRR